MRREGYNNSWHTTKAKVTKKFCQKNQGTQSGTSGGTRTHTLVKEADFESAASTNSATLATRNNLIKRGLFELWCSLK